MEQTPKPAETPKPKNRTLLYAIVVIVLIVVGVGVYILTLPPTKTVGEQLMIWDTAPSPYCRQTASPPDCGFKDSSGNSNVTVTLSTLVQWTNNGGTVHTVYSCDSGHLDTTGCPNGANSVNFAFTSPTINSGGTFQFTFSQAGKFAYYCSIHPWMHGTVLSK